MNDRLDEHQEALAHQAVMEALWTEPLLDASMSQLRSFEGASVLIAESRCGYTPLRLSAVVSDHTRIIALDPSRAMLDQARQRTDDELQRRIFFVPQHVNSLSYADDVFHTCICFHGLNTLEQLREGLHELVRVTQHGGQVAIAVPAIDCFPEVYDMLVEALRAQSLDDAADRLVSFCQEQLLNESILLTMAKELGLHDLKLARHSWKVAFSSGREVILSPVLRETLFPEWVSVIRSAEREPVLRYIADAIDTYFHGRTFECSIEAIGLIASR